MEQDTEKIHGRGKRRERKTIFAVIIHLPHKWQLQSVKGSSSGLRKPEWEPRAYKISFP